MHRGESNEAIFTGDELAVVREIAQAATRKSRVLSDLHKRSKILAQRAARAFLEYEQATGEPSVTVPREDLDWFVTAAEYYQTQPKRKQHVSPLAITAIIEAIHASEPHESTVRTVVQ